MKFVVQQRCGSYIGSTAIVDFTSGGTLYELQVLTGCIKISVVFCTFVFLFSLSYFSLSFFLTSILLRRLTSSSFPCSFSSLSRPTQVLLCHLQLQVCSLLLRLIVFAFSVLGKVSPVAISLSKPMHPSTLARASATTWRTPIRRASRTCSLMAITSARGTPAADIIRRPRWMHGNSDGHSGAAAVRARRAVLDTTLIHRGFEAGRISVTNLD